MLSSPLPPVASFHSSSLMMTITENGFSATTSLAHYYYPASLGARGVARRAHSLGDRDRTSDGIIMLWRNEGGGGIIPNKFDCMQRLERMTLA